MNRYQALEASASESSCDEEPGDTTSISLLVLKSMFKPSKENFSRVLEEAKKQDLIRYNVKDDENAIQNGVGKLTLGDDDGNISSLSVDHFSEDNKKSVETAVEKMSLKRKLSDQSEKREDEAIPKKPESKKRVNKKKNTGGDAKEQQAGKTEAKKEEQTKTDLKNNQQKKGKGKKPQEAAKSKREDDSSYFRRDIPPYLRQPLPKAKLLKKIFGKRVSKLTSKQHEIHNATNLRLSETGHFNQKMDENYHKERKKLLEAEFREFNAVLKDKIGKDKPNVKRIYVDSDPSSKGFARRLMLTKASKLLKMIPTAYNLLREMKFDDARTSSELPELKYERLLLETGKITRLFPPNLEKRFNLKPPRLVDRNRSSINDDENAKILVEKYAPDVVMSFSSARALFCSIDAPEFDDWTMPVRVINEFAQGRQKKVVYILKPLPPQSLNNMQLKFAFAKHALDNLLLMTTKGDVNARMHSQRIQEYDLFGDTYDADAVESLHASERVPSTPMTPSLPTKKEDARPTTPPMQHPSVCSWNSKSNNGAGTSTPDPSIEHAAVPATPHRRSAEACKAKNSMLLMSPRMKRAKIEIDNSSLVTPDTSSFRSYDAKTPVSSDGSASTNCDILDQILPSVRSKNLKILPLMKKPIINPEEAPAEFASEFKAPAVVDSSKNAWQYSMWKLKEHSLIIRSNIDGTYKTEDEKKLEKFVRASFLPKVEYQWEYGAEVMRLEDALRHWWTAFLKHSTVHLKAHVNPFDKYNILALDVVKCETFFRLDKLSEPTRNAIGTGMHRGWQIIDELTELDVGTYLVRKVKNALIVYSMAEDAKKCSIDLAKTYSNKWFSEKTDKRDFDALWTPIDPDVILQWHRIKKRIPCTFEPKEEKTEKKK